MSDFCGRYDPRCASDNIKNDDVTDNTKLAAFWDASEKYYSVCQYGRTSVGNGIGQYNPNVGFQDADKAFPNPDANFDNYYNIRYSNTGAPDNILPAKTANSQIVLTATTYSPELYSSEVRYIMPPAFAASFPMCVVQGTSTPAGSASATAVDGNDVILPLRCAITHTQCISSHIFTS